MDSNNASLGINDTDTLDKRYSNLVILYKRFAPSILFVDRSITPIWYLLGLFGNLLSAYVWMHPRVRRNNSSAVYLAALSIWDLVFLLLHPYLEISEAWAGIEKQSFLDCGLFHIPFLTATFLSPVLVLCFTIERWIAIWFPFKRDSLCTSKRACIVTGAMISFVLVWNLFQLQFRRYDYREGVCHIDMQSPAWKSYSAVSEALFSGVVPITALIFNLLVAFELHRITVGNKHLMPTGDGGDAAGSGERKFRSTTLMLLCVSFFVIATSLPPGLLYVLQNQDYGETNLSDAEVDRDPKWQTYFRATLIKKIVDEVSISHYSLNFVIYLLTGAQYRSYARQLFSRLFGAFKRRFCCACCRDHLPSVCGVSPAKSGGPGQRKEQLKQREDYYFNNSRTDRARRLAERTSSTSATGAETGGCGTSLLPNGTPSDSVEIQSPLIVKSSV